MLGSTIFKEHKIPTPPMGTDQSEERFMRVLGPILGDQQREIASPDIDRPMEDPLVVGPANPEFQAKIDLSPREVGC